MLEETSSLTLNELLHRARIEWHGIDLGRPDWGDRSHSIAFTLHALHGRFLFHCMMNAYWEPLSFELPSTDAGDPLSWRRCIDTAAASPDDIQPWATAATVSDRRLVVPPRSLILLAARLNSGPAGISLG